MIDKYLKLKNRNFLILLVFWILFGIWIFSFVIPDRAAAAAPQFLVSWQAQSYVPSWYQGKVMPTKDSPVRISFELIDGGRLADLSGTAVRWYVNDKLMLNENNGLGITSFGFNVPDYAGQQTEVRISLPSYRGQALDKVITIPVSSPEVVIDGRFTQNQLQIGDNSFAAVPFFFNAQTLADLDFNWVANGQQANNQSDTPWILNLNLDANTQPGYSVNLGITVQNIANQLESAAKSIQLQFSK